MISLSVNRTFLKSIPVFLYLYTFNLCKEIMYALSITYKERYEKNISISALGTLSHVFVTKYKVIPMFRNKYSNYYRVSEKKIVMNKCSKLIVFN